MTPGLAPLGRRFAWLPWRPPPAAARRCEVSVGAGVLVGCSDSGAGLAEHHWRFGELMRLQWSAASSPGVAWADDDYEPVR